MSEKILIIDDEQDIADLLEVYLKNENYVVYKFYCATDAMSCIESGDIDLAILDIMLPDMNGFSLCQLIRKKYTYPIIMLTAKIEETDKITGLTLGADDYVTKPFRPLEVVLFVICPNIRKLMGLLQRSHDWKICICGCSRRQTWKRRTDNMRLFRLELKRILKSRRTLILLAIALLLSVAMAYLPISFEGINRPNEDGTVTELDGLAAIKYKQDLYKTSAGEVTPDRIKSALETYQSCVREYGPVEEEGFPLAVFIEKIVPFRHLLMGLSEAFADPVTGIGADLMDIDPNDIDGAYYEKCAEHLQDVMRNEQRENETAQQKALEKYSELDTPFYLHSGISKDAFDYIEFYILFLAILCVAIAASTFAGEYQTGGDSIL